MVEIPIGPNIRRKQVGRDVIRRAVREELGTGPTAALVMFFGFLHPVKGLPRLIEAASYLRAAYPDLRVVLAGGCESHSVAGTEAVRLRAALESAARRHDMHANVVITGYLPEARISRLLQAADVAVFPFDSGVTLKSSSLLAALSHDVPTIATWSSRQDAYADDAVLWIPPRDTGALVAAIRRVVTDAALSEQMRRAGRGLIARHEWRHIAAMHADIYWEYWKMRPARRSTRNLCVNRSSTLNLPWPLARRNWRRSAGAGRENRQGRTLPMALFDRMLQRLLAKPVDVLVRQSLTEYFAGKWEGEDPALFHSMVYGDRSKLHIDPTAVINNALFNLSSGEITIGKYAFFGHNVCLYTGTHDFLTFGRARQITVPRTGHDIVVGEGVGSPAMSRWSAPARLARMRWSASVRWCCTTLSRIR